VPSSVERVPGQEDRLDISHLGRILRERRGSLSIRRAAAEAGVSFSTLSRVEAGAQPDLATFSRLCGWLGVAPGRFFSPLAERELSPLEQAIAHLQTDPRLTEEAAARISSVLRSLYDALAASATPGPTVVRHLRAASVMRPGVAPRLAAMLRDMHEELAKEAEARIS
jgi:transcriptional regulator with XRE-family HTH domain